MEKKRALIEKAKALKDSTEWKKTADKFIALQKEWKTIGPVPKKQGDQLWEEFLAACNSFFEARKAATSGQRNEEHANLSQKKALIAQLQALIENPAENLQEEVGGILPVGVVFQFVGTGDKGTFLLGILFVALLQVSEILRLAGKETVA